VTVLADGITEPAETFLVKLSGATNATWNAEIVSRVGNRYTIRSASWNGTIAAGATVTFGFQGTPGLGSLVPTNVMLNGVLV
jgi:hypothetical protein